MGLRRLLAPLLCLLLLAGCAGEPPGGNDLLSEARAEGAVLTLGCCDGQSVTYWRLWDKEEREALLTALSAVPAQAAPDWMAEEAAAPVYAVTAGSIGDGFFQAAWSNGYWITDTGTAYRFDFDFAALLSACSWEEEGTYASAAGLPCARFLCRQGDLWRTELMPEAEPLLDLQEGLVLTVQGLEEGQLRAGLRNETGEDRIYGEGFHLQVLLEEAWRDVPVQSEMMFNTIAHPLPAGETAEISLDVGFHYGELPPGRYRLVLWHTAAGEFTL